MHEELREKVTEDVEVVGKVGREQIVEEEVEVEELVGGIVEEVVEDKVAEESVGERGVVNKEIV